ASSASYLYRCGHPPDLPSFPTRRSSDLDVRFNGETTPEKALYTVLNVSLPCTEIGDMLLFKLDIKGISVSGGSACSSGSDIGSHVLRHLGVDASRPSVRFSFSKQNTREEVDYAVSVLKDICLGS